MNPAPTADASDIRQLAESWQQEGGRDADPSDSRVGTRSAVGPGSSNVAKIASSANATDTTTAGWEFTPSGGATSLTAEFRAPRLTCTDATRAIALAISLYSGTRKKMEFNVAGVIEQCYRGGASAVPDVGVNGGTQDIDHSLHVHPGDLVALTVDSSSSKTWATVVDRTKGHRFTVTESRRGSGAGLVELMGEDTVLAPHSTTRLAVPDFGTVQFSSAAVAGRAIGAIPPPDRVAINLVTSDKAMIILTGPIGGKDDNTFSSIWLRP